MEVSSQKVLDRETREVKVLKIGLETHEVVTTEHDDDKEAEEEQNLGIEQKPEVSQIAKIKEIIPKESENSESPDTEPGQPLHSEVPTIGVPPPEEEPPKISPNKSFTYTHGPTIPQHPPERRSDWQRPDGWIPTEWAGVSPAVRAAIYEDWKANEPEAAQKAFEAAQAYDAALKAKREAKAKAAEEKKRPRRRRLLRSRGCSVGSFHV